MGIVIKVFKKNPPTKTTSCYKFQVYLWSSVLGPSGNLCKTTTQLFPLNWNLNNRFSPEISYNSFSTVGSASLIVFRQKSQSLSFIVQVNCNTPMKANNPISFYLKIFYYLFHFNSLLYPPSSITCSFQLTDYVFEER